jgi:hypothetical protein
MWHSSRILPTFLATCVLLHSAKPPCVSAFLGGNALKVNEVQEPETDFGLLQIEEVSRCRTITTLVYIMT